MKRTTPRPINHYRDVYKKYTEAQFTLEELLAEFSDYTIYGTLENTEIHIVDTNNKLYLFFESIGYDDEECIPTIYEISPYEKQGTDFDDIAFIYLDDCEKITKLN